MKVQTAFSVGVVTIAFGLGCSVYDNSLLEGAAASASTVTGGSGGGGGGGNTTDAMSGGAAGMAGSGDFCLGAPRAWYPPRPTTAEVPDTGEDITFVNATYTIDLGDRPPGPTPPTAYRNIGLDLDDQCTTETDLDLGECAQPPWATGTVDGPGGIDNAMGTIIQAVRDRVSAWGSETYTQQLQAGGVNLLYRVSGYNGAPNDDHVRVETFVAVAINALNPDAGAPKWDGTDVFDVASDSVLGGPSEPKYFDDRAYVKDGQLVASYASTVRLEIALSSLGLVRLNLALTPSAILCDLHERSADGGALGADHWEMTCTLAGRWETDHLLHQLSQFPDPLNPGAPLCTNSTSYSAFKPIVCRPTDMYAGMLFPSAQCNALSFGTTFTTKPARLGDVYVLSQPVERCPAGSRPSEDTCANLPPISGGTGGAGGAGGAAGSGGTSGTGGAGDASTGGGSGAAGTAGSASDAGDASTDGP